MTKKRIKHKIAKDEEILRQLEKKELNEHGYWEKGYRQGRLSVLYNLLDENRNV